MKPTPLTDAILSQPEASKLTFAQRSDLRAIESDRAELIEALRGMLETHSNITEGNLHSGAQERVAVKRDARALLSRLGAE